MRTFALTAGVVGFLAISGCATTVMAQPYGPYGHGGISVSVDAFYDTLSPYGEWVTVGGYGRVWRPYPEVVGVDFRPYATGGHWVYTEYGWSFESDFAWGWAPFHYGRWWIDPVYGWVWRPDTVWAPAWVDWRFGGGYVGWAPLPPPGVVVVESYHPAWCFVETRHFIHPYFYRYALPPERVHIAFSSTYAVHDEVTYGGARWYAGPPVQHVATAVGQSIQPVRVAPPRPGYVQPVRVPPPAYATGPRPPGGQGSFAPPHTGPSSSLAYEHHGIGQPNGGWPAPSTRYNAPPPMSPRPHGGGFPPPPGGGGGFHPAPGMGGGTFRPPPPSRPTGAPATRPSPHRH